jgi:hypothetical protein
MWGYIFLLLIIVPMLVDHFVTTPISIGRKRFTAFEWNALFVGLLIVSLTVIGLQRVIVLRFKKETPIWQKAFALYAYGGSPAGFCAVVTHFLILFELEIFGFSTQSVLWICIFIFGSISVYGMRQADKLVERILKDQGG